MRSLLLLLLGTAFLLATAGPTGSDDMVWVVDPATHERYQVLRSIYELDKAFFVGDDTLSGRFTHQYLEDLANQCDASPAAPGTLEFLNHTFMAVVEFCLQPHIYSYSFEIYRRLFETIRWGPYMVAGFVALVFTAVRYLITKVFLGTRVGKRFTTDHSKQKVITPLWSILSYSFLYTVEATIVYVWGYEDFVYPLCIFRNIHFKPGYFDQQIPAQYYWLYMFHIGFYAHSFYASLCLDVRRKDTSIILIHHLLTIALLSFSFFAKFHRVGLLVLFLHDISDVLLELGKFFVVLRPKFPENAKLLDNIANFFFGLFVITWFYLRIYLFPTKIIYGTTWGVYLTHLDREAYFFLFFNSMLTLLYVLHLYWSYFILVMVLKKSLGRMPNLEDERDFDSDSSTNGLSPSTGPTTNGVYKNEKKKL